LTTGDSSSSSLSASSSSSAPSFNVDFSSPTPFGSFFGSTGGAVATPSLTSSGFSLFSSAASSSSSASSDFAFSLSSSSSSLLFSSGAESSSTTIAERVEVVTGEEDEERVHSVRAKLLKLETVKEQEGQEKEQKESQSWKEKGSGQLHLNVARDRSYARLVMRAEGALRLVLNAALLPPTVATRVQERGVQVSAMEEGKVVWYLLRVSRRDEAEDLFHAINKYKNITTGGAAAAKEEAK
jgi:Ran-binding protein 3